MKLKYGLLLLIVLSLAIIGTIKTKSKNQDQARIAELERSREKGTINWYVQMAKAKGEARIGMPAPIIEYVTHFKDINEALTYYNFLIAQPIEAKTLAYDDNKIVTWYKFKIIRGLSKKKLRHCESCPTPSEAPKEMLPLNPNEILVPKNGGTLVTDGVEVSMRDSLFPEFEISRQYLLVLQIDPSGQVGKIMVGPNAIFTLNPDGSLIPINDRPHILKEIINTHYGSSIEQLSEGIKNQPNLQ
jgi:hypothetical protein